MFSLVLGLGLFVAGNVVAVFGHGAPWLDRNPTLVRRTLAGAVMSVTGAILTLVSAYLSLYE